jgi:hypothetical protein
LLNVDEIKDVAERIDGARRVKVLVDMGYHFKPFAIESMFFDEEVRHRRLAVIGNNFFPPDTRGSVENRRDKFLGIARPIRSAA